MTDPAEDDELDDRQQVADPDAESRRQARLAALEAAAREAESDPLREQAAEKAHYLKGLR